jgi:hypothetical protein
LAYFRLGIIFTQVYNCGPCIYCPNYNRRYLISGVLFFVFCAVLREPLFDDVTVREGALLKITCVPRNIPAITTTQILDSRGMAVSNVVLGVVTIDSAFRNASGVYTCLVTNTLNNNTINATATVVVECKLK